MKTDAWLRVIAVLLAFGAGAWLVRSCEERADAAAIHRADSLQSRLVTLQVAGQVAARQDSARSDSISRLTLAVVRLVARKPVVQSKTDTLVGLVPDTALRDSLRAALTAERAVADSTIQAQTVVIRLWSDGYKSMRAERDAYRTVSEELNRQLQAAVHRPVRSRLRPCLFAGYGIGGATVGAGACYSL